VIAPDDRGTEWADVRRVSLVAEVVSPSSRLYDAFDKRRVYQDREVGLYWIIDPALQCAEVWTPDAQAPRRETVALTWHPEGASEPFRIELSRLFSD
jgi:Uma2 family endonuclease